jgi:hypothetical protein
VAYVWDEENETFVTDNIIENDKDYYMGVEGLRGFKEVNGLVDFGASIRMFYDNGEEFHYSGDIMSETDLQTAEEIMDEVNLSFNVYDFEDEDRVKIVAKFWDNNSDKTYLFKCNFEISDDYSYDWDF